MFSCRETIKLLFTSSQWPLGQMSFPDASNEDIHDSNSPFPLNMCQTQKKLKNTHHFQTIPAQFFILNFPIEFPSIRRKW